MSNIERNLCMEAGCLSSCCHDMKFFMIDKPTDYFQNSQKMPENSNGQVLKKGVYFSISGGQYKVTIIGDCPNLNEKMCSIYSNRPPGCKKLRIGLKNCLQARERDDNPIKESD